MFESQVAYYLDRYLGRYVSGLDAAALRISVWSGDIALSNLALKPEALEELGLPVTVVSGVLGKLTLKVSSYLVALGHYLGPWGLGPVGRAGCRNTRDLPLPSGLRNLCPVATRPCRRSNDCCQQ